MRLFSYLQVFAATLELSQITTWPMPIAQVFDYLGPHVQSSPIQSRPRESTAMNRPSPRRRHSPEFGHGRTTRFSCQSQNNVGPGQDHLNDRVACKTTPKDKRTSFPLLSRVSTRLIRDNGKSCSS